MKARLEHDLREAMRASDDLRKRTLRMALSSIRLSEIEKGAALDEAMLQNILRKELKSRQEAIEDARRANRPDLEKSNQDEMQILEEYLPRQLTPQELEDLVKQVIAELGVHSQKEMGQVMKALIPRLEGRATGDQASQVVRRLLQ